MSLHCVALFRHTTKSSDATDFLCFKRGVVLFRISQLNEPITYLNCKISICSIRHLDGIATVIVWFGLNCGWNLIWSECGNRNALARPDVWYVPLCLIVEYRYFVNDWAVCSWDMCCNIRSRFNRQRLCRQPNFSTVFPLWNLSANIKPRDVNMQ